LLDNNLSTLFFIVLSHNRSFDFISSHTCSDEQVAGVATDAIKKLAGFPEGMVSKLFSYVT